MIYDCFPFYNELELLEIRLHELDPLVDRFVICESNYTFQGNPKPLYYLENKKLFEKFNHKIIHVMFDASKIKGTAETRYVRDIGQRNHLIKGLKYCNKNDIIIVSDVDEIPDRKKLLPVLNYLDYYDCLSFFNDFYTFKFNLKIGKWHGSTIRRFDSVKKINSIQLVRDYRDKPDRSKIYQIEGGWHFTFLGDEKRIQAKFDNWGHTQDYSHIKSMKDLEDNLTYFNGEKVTRVPIDDSFPEYFLKNQDKFKSLIV